MPSAESKMPTDVSHVVAADVFRLRFSSRGETRRLPSRRIIAHLFIWHLALGTWHLAFPAQAQTTQPALDAVRALQPLTLPPLAPQPWPSTTLTPAPLKNWLPQADPMLQPRLTAADTANRSPIRPALDLPEPVALPAVAAATRVLPAYPLARGVSPDVGNLASLPRKVRPNSERAVVFVDNTMAESLMALQAVTAGLRTTAAPFVRLVIPTPTELTDSMPLRTTHPDDEPPIHLPPPYVRPVIPATK